MAFILFVGGITLGFGIGWIAWGNRISDLNGEVRRQISLREESAAESAAERQALARAEERIAETQAELSGALMQNDQLRAEHWELRRSLAIATGQHQRPVETITDTSALEEALATAEQALEEDRARQSALEAELRAVRAERDAEAGQVAALRAELAATVERPGESQPQAPAVQVTPPRKRIAQILREAQVDGAVQRTVSDDLTAINGIGPILRRKLQDLGITNLRQIAAMSPDDVERVDAVLNFKGRIDRERWIEQARDILSAR